jgi:hypothetical protein
VGRNERGSRQRFRLSHPSNRIRHLSGGNIADQLRERDRITGTGRRLIVISATGRWVNGYRRLISVLLLFCELLSG